MKIGLKSSLIKLVAIIIMYRRYINGACGGLTEHIFHFSHLHIVIMQCIETSMALFSNRSQHGTLKEDYRN